MRPNAPQREPEEGASLAATVIRSYATAHCSVGPIPLSGDESSSLIGSLARLPLNPSGKALLPDLPLAPEGLVCRQPFPGGCA